MRENSKYTTEEAPESQIETIAVDPDEIIEALRFNDGRIDKRTAYLRVHPPFDTKVEAKIFHQQSGNYYPPEMDPKPIHIRPERFVDDDANPVPNRGLERDRAQEDLDEPTEEEVREYVETVFKVWEDNIQSHLLDELDEGPRLTGDRLSSVAIEYDDQL